MIQWTRDVVVDDVFGKSLLLLGCDMILWAAVVYIFLFVCVHPLKIKLCNGIELVLRAQM